jgi:kanamycin kinase
VTDRILANRPEGPVAVPELVRAFARDLDALDAIWLNDLGGVTFRDGDRYLKWSPLGPVDLDDERARLEWAAPRHPVPEVLDFGRDDHGQVLITRALNGSNAVTEEWRGRPREAVRAIAEGLRALHELPAADCPFVCRWAETADVSSGDVVVVQGDPCAPNTIIGGGGRFAGHVDLGSLGTADRWSDLAVASMSLDWNYGPGWQDEFFAAYGIAPDGDRIRHYRALWDGAP